MHEDVCHGQIFVHLHVILVVGLPRKIFLQKNFTNHGSIPHGTWNTVVSKNFDKFFVSIRTI